jgi:hypothetical protein
VRREGPPDRPAKYAQITTRPFACTAATSPTKYGIGSAVDAQSGGPHAQRGQVEVWVWDDDMPDFIAQLAASYRGPKNGRGNQHLSVHAKLPYRWSRHTRLEPSPLAGPIRHLAGIDHNLAGGRRTDEQSRLGEVQPGPARHSARPVSVLHGDGDGRVVIEVRRRTDDQVVAVSASALAFSTSAGFQRSARTLRWLGTTTVEVVPWAGLW